MAWRTNEADVRGVIETDPDIAVAPFIDFATNIVDYVVTKDTNSVLTSAMLVEIERWLAAHFYAIRDPQYQEKKTGDASAVFQGKTDLGFDLTHWGQMAKRADVTGTLASMDRGRVPVSVSWLGKAPSEQTDYGDRD